MIDKLKDFWRLAGAYYELPFFDGFDDDGPIVLSDVRPLRPEHRDVIVSVLREFATVADALAVGYANQFDARVLVRLKNDLALACGRVERDAAGGLVPEACYVHRQIEDAAVLVEAIEARVARPKDKVANAIGMLAADPSLALLTDNELAERFEIVRQTLFKETWKPVRDAIDAIRQREAPSPRNQDEDE